MSGAIGARHDPVLNHNFVISLLESTSSLSPGAPPALAGILDAAAGGFAECSGLELAMQPEEYKEGGNNGGVLKFASRVTWTNLTLKRGVTDGTELWDWHFSFVEGRGRRRDGVIVLLDAARAPVQAWYFRRGLPVKYTGPSFNAAQNNVAIEAIEIAHEGIHQVPGVGGGKPGIGGTAG
jgi:phage tail-like protein